MAVEVALPFYGGVDLALELCPEHRDVVERAVVAVGELMFQTGLEVLETSAVAWWRGQAS